MIVNAAIPRQTMEMHPPHLGVIRRMAVSEEEAMLEEEEVEHNQHSSLKTNGIISPLGKEEKIMKKEVATVILIPLVILSHIYQNKLLQFHQISMLMHQ